MSTNPQNDRLKTGCEDDSCDCGGLSRRDFVRLVGLGAAACSAGLPAFAGPFTREDFDSLVPADKKLKPEWVASLFARGEPETYTGADLQRIGMPIGGLFCGMVYLSGDGRLWLWDIFNRNQLGVLPKPARYQGHDLNAMGGSAYVAPLLAEADHAVEQGFTLTVHSPQGPVVKNLDAGGFQQVTFTGQYPIGVVDYADPAVPVRVKLEAFSPFVPLATDDSSLPTTVFRFQLTNTGSQPVELTLAGMLENAVGPDMRAFPGTRRNSLVKAAGATMLRMSLEFAPKTDRPDILFEDWSKEGYEGWTVEGTAFGKGPVRKKDVPGYQGDLGGDTPRVANSHASAPGADVGQKDDALGTLTSKPFAVERNFIHLWIGGGNHAGQTCVNVLVDGKVVRSLTGKANNHMEPALFDLREFQGRQAVLQIVDQRKGAWGNIGVGRITLSDSAAAGTPQEQRGYGTMCLALLGDEADQSSGDQQVAAGEKLVGSLGRRLKLEAGQSREVDFLVAWHFPNVGILPKGRRHYAARFADAQAVAQYVAGQFDRLAAQTRLWRDTWYDSTLPHWFLNRTMANTSILATTTCHRFDDGRFWAWEGIGCCAGLALNADGAIRFRAEHNNGPAIDAQTGTILRAYREHQMSKDDAFLRATWPGIRRAMDWLILQDADADGLIECHQHNTLDTDWFGPVAWLSGMYLASLRACEEMARELGENATAARCREIYQRGQANLVARLFEGEYFINRPDPAHPESINSGTGCHIDQVLGQCWAWQVALGRVLPEKETRQALTSLWRYNFTPDVGPYRQANKPGRWYAVAGEGGLLMCTFPRTDWDYRRASGKGPDWAAGYFNECMSGFEHQVASHMVWEGLVMEGLAITRAIHDRYRATFRNPYNEVECSDHYARAMASYGTYLAACGYEYHGPNRHLAFAPRLTPEKFQAAFTTAEGWGTFRQTAGQGQQTATLEVKWGRLPLRTLTLAALGGKPPAIVKATLGDRALPLRHEIKDGRLTVTFADETTIETGQRLEVVLA
jgi:non-lysosomal glucosylceramidase